ncbi:Protein DHS-5 [Aphelenchoides avenae]|nr:Protein DHS-5 [Aphelenchus avenae]
MERGGGGQIVVLSSSQGCRPIPLLAAYSSAKSLLSFLCECLDREYKAIRKGSTFVVTMKTFACQAVNTVGLARVTSGCLNHDIQMLLMHLFPWSILKYLIMPIYWRHQKRMIHLLGRPPVLAAKPGLKNDAPKAEEAGLTKSSGSVEDVSAQA